LTDTQTWGIVGASPTHAPNYQFKIDEFKVVKNGTVVVLDDQFSDNNPPPSAPALSYSVTGTVSEQGGKAVLNGALTPGLGRDHPRATPRAQFFAEAPEQSDSVLQGTYGQLDITQAGAWTYQVANGQANVQALYAGQIVTDTFTAQVADGHGGFDTKTITVNVTGTNDAPVAVADAAAITEDALPGTVSGNLLTNDTDVDTGDTHRVSAVTGGADGGIISPTITKVGTYGTLVVTKATGA